MRQDSYHLRFIHFSSQTLATCKALSLCKTFLVMFYSSLKASSAALALSVSTTAPNCPVEPELYQCQGKQRPQEVHLSPVS